MKKARFIVGLLALLCGIAAIANYLAEYPHVSTFQAIASIAMIIVLILIGTFFLMLIVTCIFEA
jgi:hypothetical protein